MSQQREKGLTEAIFQRIAQTESEAGGAGASVSYAGLLNLDNAWADIKNGGWKNRPKQVVFDRSTESSTLPQLQYDVIVCGGTLGIFYAAALQSKGYKVGVIERNKVSGRSQEWNISKKELRALFSLGILNSSTLQEVIGIEFNPVRIGFQADTSPGSENVGFEVYVRDILNLGVKPDKLIELVKDQFLGNGGVIIEDATLMKVEVYNSGALVQYLTKGAESVANIGSRLVIDAMGGNSPIMKQFRGPVAPDGVCVVVGTCASGFPAYNNTYSDLIYADSPIITPKASNTPMQYFWEAFPAGSGPSDRTSYLFTYLDAQPERPSIKDIMEDYWELLPRYQGVSIDDLTFQRVLYGMFPVYRNSPLRPNVNRLLPVGDASGVQSPLSFGGFGSLTRHIERIVGAVSEALDSDLLTADDMGRINAYLPNLSAYWMFQRAMSVPVGRKSPRGVVLGTLTNSFSAMTALGEDVMRPFLQDVLQFVPLLRTLLLAGKQDPWTPFKIVPHVGLQELLGFVYHFSIVGLYTLLSTRLSKPLQQLSQLPWLSPRSKYRLRRLIEAWKFGSGLDYNEHN